jgi:hypothetical protein
LTATKFDEVYRGKSPVIVADGAVGWPALTRWTPDYLAKAFGDAEFSFGGSLVRQFVSSPNFHFYSVLSHH